MALLNLGKKKTAAKASEKMPASAGKLAVSSSAKNQGSVVINPMALKRPHITEKAAAASEKGVYVFEVGVRANKNEIAAAVRALYKVTPVKVRTVTIPAKRITMKGRPGISGGSKKAYVYLKKGEKIELV